MKTLIIGGGAIGLFSAYYLHKAGCEVTVLERGDFSDGCSFGNAGMVVPSHVAPLASPGMVAKGLRMLFDAKSPFYIRPRASGDLLRWGYLFWKSCTEAHVRRAIPYLRDISWLSKSLFQDLHRSGEVAFEWQERGLFMLYKTADTEHEETEFAKLANAQGIEAHKLSQKEVQAMEPDVEVDVRGAIYFPGDCHLYPNLLIKNLVDFLKKSGVQILDNQDVIDFSISGNRIKSVLTSGGEWQSDEVILAAGSWSADLTKKLGFSIPLQGGKGYSLLLKNVEKNVRIPGIMLEARSTATPMGGDLRFAGTMEIAGTDLSVNRLRVQGIVESVQKYYPDFQLQGPDNQQIWRGLRPCSPDGLPYIGRISKLENLTVATGHGMMGVSLGPATGKLVSEIVRRQPTSMDIGAFEVERF